MSNNSNRKRGRSAGNFQEPVQRSSHVQDGTVKESYNCPEYWTKHGRESYLYSSADSLDDLIEATYSCCNIQLNGFCRDIARSAYAYYIAVLCYARLLKLESLNLRTLTYDENLFLQRVYECNLNVPMPVAMYLSAFGNIDHPHYGGFLFKMQKPILTQGGYFGPIEHNMYAYASYPCLGVYAQRMFNDLHMVRGRESWDLPDEYRYEGHSLTSKCLGYREATFITSEQQTFLQYNLPDEFCRTESIPFLSLLVLIISMNLKSSGIELVKLSDKRMGSLGQIMTVKYIEDSKSYSYSCPFRTHKSIEFLGGLFKFNIDKGKEQFTDSNNYKKLLPVKFTADQEVPAEVNINILYESSSCAIKAAHYRGFIHSNGIMSMHRFIARYRGCTVSIDSDSD